MNLPKWIDEIEQEAASTAFGELNFHIKRHKSQTSIMEVTSYTKLKYVENNLAFADIERLLNNLIDSTYTGKLQFEVIYNHGNIDRLAIKNTKITNYREQK